MSNPNTPDTGVLGFCAWRAAFSNISSVLAKHSWIPGYRSPACLRDASAFAIPRPFSDCKSVCGNPVSSM